MRYNEFLGLVKFVSTKKQSIILLTRRQFVSRVKKYYRRPYYQLLKLYNFLTFFKIYKFNYARNFPNFWKYLRINAHSRLFNFLKIYQKYTIFFFSHKVRNLFCIIWQGSNIETFFSAYLCANRRARANFLSQLKIIRYIIYLYFQDITSNLKLNFSKFSIKIKHIIKLFFYWLSFYAKLALNKKTFFLHYIIINNKFPRGPIKKKTYPTKKRYLQRKSNTRVVLN